MKKNLLLRLCLMMTVVLSLYSCIHDEVYSSADQSSTEYINKSLWEQDEKYIKNVMAVYAENEDEIKKVSGTPYWNYATTVESFDESFVAVPIVSGRKVVSVMKVPRHGSKIYFYYTADKNDLEFFQGLVFANYKKIIPLEFSDMQTEGMACKRQWFSVWLPDDESNPDPASGPGQWHSTSVIVCKQFVDECTGVVNEFGICDQGGAGDGGGWDYPGAGGDEETPEPPKKEPCEKIQEIGKNNDTKTLFENLKTKTNSTKEFGEILIESNGQINNIPKQGEVGQGGIDISYSGGQIDGFIHSHYTGLLSIFSPADIASLSAMYASGSIKDLNTFIMGIVTASNTQYMMVIDDPTAFASFAQQFLLPNGEIDRDKTDLFALLQYGKYDIKNNGLASNNELGFVKLLSENSSGLKILKGSNNSNNWSELALKNGQVDPKPCN
ncbi:hypothetical protein [Chryseobacterium indoltheticum]|uniref:hypothetical protein n=1 Tax=Chryseobacterium indoltheticum TaxID=254 RepID=UPI00191310E9|nr:hypothetical protein [Chryseobacterium indoltheticum]QQQ30016.1 hypothetical protein JJL46_08435 [Chryseobacterium indoltheticum]